MTGRPHHDDACQLWADAAVTDLQHQIDELADQVRAFIHLVHAHTLTALDPPPVERRHE